MSDPSDPKPSPLPSDAKIIVVLLLLLGGFTVILSVPVLGVVALWYVNRDGEVEVVSEETEADSEDPRVEAAEASRPSRPTSLDDIFDTPPPPPGEVASDEFQRALRRALEEAGSSQDEKMPPRAAEVIRKMLEGEAEPAAKAPNAAAAVEPTAVFDEHSIRKTKAGALWIYGRLTNTSPIDVQHPSVTVNLYAKDGSELLSKSIPAAFSHLEAGRSAAVQLLVSKPPDYATIDYRVSVKPARHAPRQVSRLSVKPGKSQKKLGGRLFRGKVTNESSQPARFVRVEIVGLDGDGRVVGMGYTYAVGADGRLDAGATATYKSPVIYFAKKPIRFEYRATAKPID